MGPVGVAPVGAAPVGVGLQQPGSCQEQQEQQEQRQCSASQRAAQAPPGSRSRRCVRAAADTRTDPGLWFLGNTPSCRDVIPFQ